MLFLGKIMNTTEIRATAAPWYSGIELLVRDGDSFGVSIVMEHREPGYIVDPTMKISRDAAQILMDDLWGAGIRPSDGSGNTGQLRATENHLKDMRKIVFKQLEID
jgi:hypothetical protein